MYQGSRVWRQPFVGRGGGGCSFLHPTFLSFMPRVSRMSDNFVILLDFLLKTEGLFITSF